MTRKDETAASVASESRASSNPSVAEEQEASSRDGRNSAKGDNPDGEGDGNSESGDDSSEESDREEEKRDVLPEIRYCDYQGFVNRDMDDEGDFAIEVLVVQSAWEAEVLAEHRRREMLTTDRNLIRFFSGAPPSRGPQKKISPTLEDFGTDRRIQRVRIRSKTVLYHLSELTRNKNMAKAPLIFCRPFRTLEYYHEEMKRKLEELEKLEAAAKLPIPEVGEDLVKESPPPSESPRPETPAGENVGNEAVETPAPEGTPKKDAAEGILDPNAVKEMRCYIDFVEARILPIRRQFQSVEKQTRRTVKYEEIPYLFQPGSLAYVPNDSESGKALHRSAIQNVWRMAECCPSDHPHEFIDKSGIFDAESLRLTTWNVYCLDYNGEKMSPIWRNIEFKYFKDEKDITALECYPLHYHQGYQNLLRDQTESGRLFKSCVSQSVRHLYFSGWTMVSGILGEKVEDQNGVEVRHPEYMESEIVVDFKETLRSFPKWGTESSLVSSSWDWSEKTAESRFMIWRQVEDDVVDIEPAWDLTDTMLVREDELYAREKTRYFEHEDKFLQEGRKVSEEEWDEEDLALLPKRVFGYVLRERKFARLDVRGIQWNSKQSKITLDNIQMKDSHRKIIRSAVSSHFKAKEQERELGISTFDLDVIQGKAKGLVILLHGAPGVGKTVTAEAVAIENNRPLFPITCGDLGFSPSAVSKSLKDIFRYAHLWECILLLDEADVFLTQRERGGGNLERNALVGVFLRVLEYYSGILFLTTNRVGALDEAFRSRVHISLCYPPLTKTDTIEILKSNLNRLPKPENNQDKAVAEGMIKIMEADIVRFVEEEYAKYAKKMAKAKKRPRGPWNGRQIRNAVQIATCLALYDKEVSTENDGLPAILTADHFRSVAETTREFERYLEKTKIGDDGFIARQRQERDDEWRDDGEDDEDAHSIQYYSYDDDMEAEERAPSVRSGYADVPNAGRKAPKKSSRMPSTPQGRRSGIQNQGSSSKASTRQSRAPRPRYEEDEYYEEDYQESNGQYDERSSRRAPGSQRGQKNRQADMSSRNGGPRQHQVEEDEFDDEHYSEPEEDDDYDNDWPPESAPSNVRSAGPSSRFGQRRYVWNEGQASSPSGGRQADNGRGDRLQRRDGGRHTRTGGV